ncbi:MAG TPA: outer membrane beta-barrel protein [Capillibacterium sp.]|nr:outer membrane beta-barrel protein [Bacillota bacterium]
MRKTRIVLVFVLLLSTMSCRLVWAGATVKLGFEPGGDLSTNISGYMLGYGVDAGVSVSGEYLKALNDQVEVGGGLEYQLKRNVRGLAAGFRFIPLYGMVKVKAPFSADLDTYFTGKIGYNYLALDEQVAGFDYGGGFYYGVGFGLDLNEKIMVEAEYSVNRGELGYILKQPFDYAKIRFGVGYKF